MQFKGPPHVHFGQWPQTIDIMELDDFPGYVAPYRLYVNSYDLPGRCPKCRRKYSVTKLEEASMGEHVCPQPAGTKIKKAKRKHKPGKSKRMRPGSAEYYEWIAQRQAQCGPIQLKICLSL